MKQQHQNERAIVHNLVAVAYSDFSFHAISPGALERLRLVDSSTVTSANQRLIKILECFLQITDQHIDIQDLAYAPLSTIFRNFFGALCCERFVNYTAATRREVLIQAHRLFMAVATASGDRKLDGFHVTTKNLTEFLLECRSQFRSLPLNEDKVWLWRAWPSTNSSGRETQLPLFSVYCKLGREFTVELHRVCDEYYRGRKTQRIIAIGDLSKFIGSHPEISTENIKSTVFMDKFWREFFLFYLKNGYEDGLTIAYLLRNWNNEFVIFAKEYLIQSQLFSGPIGAFPSSPNGSYSNPKHTHISVSEEGQRVRTKLITYIPLELSDTEAMNILFSELKRDNEIALKWGREMAANIWHRHCKHKARACKGTARTISWSSRNTGMRKLVEADNPLFLENISATFELHRYQVQDEACLPLLYGNDLSLAANALALPTTGSLLAHCVILVANHPIITPSFLENLELYDKNENITGYTTKNETPVLVGFKARKGFQQSLQTVYLNEETDAIVKQIIELTTPLRLYLKKIKDDNWRKLLLVCGSAFGYPRPLKRIAADTSIPERRERFAGEIADTTGISIDDARDYMTRFSLPALRSQVGVLIYIETKDCAKMAAALGHAEYEPKLLARYLPDSILSFFQERWIRIFQTGIVVTAMEDSPNLLAASGFKSLKELNTFLSNHALSRLPSQEDKTKIDRKIGNKKDNSSEILFNVNSDVLNLFISLKTFATNPARPVRGVVQYWSDVGEHLINYLDSDECKQPDLKKYLSVAKSMPAINFLDEIIYE